MIKPSSLWALFKTCEDPAWLGKVCMALGGQDVELDFSQQQMVNVIKMDSGWMDENAEAMREKWREYKRNKNKTESSEKLESSKKTVESVKFQDYLDSSNSTLPSFHPSFHPNISTPNKLVVDDINARDNGKSGVVDERYVFPPKSDQEIFAEQMGIPAEYIETFNSRIREIGFQYISRNGQTVNIRRDNWKTVLRKFWTNDKAKKDGMIARSKTALSQDGYIPTIDEA